VPNAISAVWYGSGSFSVVRYCCLREENGVPSVSFEVGHALLDARRDIRQHLRALLRHDRDALDGAAVDLGLGGADDLAEVVDPTALEVLGITIILLGLFLAAGPA
jgi:hypothetical protein